MELSFQKNDVVKRYGCDNIYVIGQIFNTDGRQGGGNIAIHRVKDYSDDIKAWDRSIWDKVSWETEYAYADDLYIYRASDVKKLLKFLGEDIDGDRTDN